MAEKTRLTSGADEQTPSHPQYFSWLNNTNEGATEQQTLINLAYFKWLHDTYGMELEIYAWDAGNLDGAGGTYAHPDETPKLKVQYPNGYGPSAKAAADFGCSLGVWAGADGFGDTPEEEAKRRELMVSLCRDYGFKEFKVDTVCGHLRPEKREVFKSMIDECRRYVPDLVLLNHRNELGEAEICATTFLLGGMETYIDVMCSNHITGSHHRMVTLDRDLVPGMQRLTEDHGVCLNSYLDYFEDDLILQAFARSLILAPELYGNPWLLRDDEQERLAKIYTLHWKYRDILVHGIHLPEETYGRNAASRGDGKTRLIALTNPTWNKMPVKLSLSEEIGLTASGKYIVKTIHPEESYVGTYRCGDVAEITVEPCRSALILVQEESLFNETDFVLTGCSYETIPDSHRLPGKIRIWSGNGEEIGIKGNRSLGEFALKKAFATTEDHRIKAPVYLGRAEKCDLPQNAEQLYEATCFRADSDSLEYRSLKRSGETAIPEVKAAREAFFNQETYTARGLECRAMFDDDPDTFFDGETVYYWGGKRLNNGCLRLDLGETRYISRMTVECFEINEPVLEVPMQHYPEMGQYTAEAFTDWKNAPLTDISVTAEDVTAPVVVSNVHDMKYEKGVKKTASYEIGGRMRFFRLDNPMDRIYAIRFYDEKGGEIKVNSPKVNNMLSPFVYKPFTRAMKAVVRVPETVSEGSYLAIALDGIHGIEGAYCAAMVNGAPVGCDDRAVTFPMNCWAHMVDQRDRNYTYYMPADEKIRGKEVTLYVLLGDKAEEDLPVNVWLCDGPHKAPITVFEKE